MARVDLAELSEELVGEVGRARTDPNVAIFGNIEPGLFIHSDRLKLKMIVKNLMTNAVKFTRQGSVTPRAAKSDDGVKLTVRDSGIGIAPEPLATLFDAFEQAHGEESVRAGGVGLCLHICKRLAHYLGVTLTVKSTLGNGSEFCLAVR